MKTNYIYKLGIFLICITGLTSCEERIDLKLNDTYTRIVVEGEITTEAKAHKIKLTTSSSYFYNQKAPAITGATVTISDNAGNTFLLNEIPVGSGIYYTDASVQGIIGRTYTLKIDGVDINKDGKKESYFATDLLKSVAQLDSISFEKTKNHKGDSVYLINGWMHEPPSTGDYYIWKYSLNGIPQSDTVSNQQFTDDLMVNGNNIPGFTLFRSKAKKGDTIVIETRSASKGYYDYLTSFMLETSWNMGGGGFSGPPANIKTNVSSGGLGWFSASDIKYKKAIILQ